MSLSVKRRDVGAALDQLRMSGSLKCLFPRGETGKVVGVLVNTAGGITGGDRFEISAAVAPDSALTLTTQTAERAYRAQPDEWGHVATTLRVGRGARLQWLPQETILFNGSALSRKIRIDLAPGAGLLLAEPLIFGRTEMGESVTDARFRDCIDIRRDGHSLFLDRITLRGDLAAHLDRPHVARGARAMALIVYVGADADRRLGRLRAVLSNTGGASLIGADVLVARILGADGYTLRQTLLPALTFLSDTDLPKCWTL